MISDNLIIEKIIAKKEKFEIGDTFCIPGNSRIYIIVDISKKAFNDVNKGDFKIKRLLPIFKVPVWIKKSELTFAQKIRINKKNMKRILKSDYNHWLEIRKRRNYENRSKYCSKNKKTT